MTEHAAVTDIFTTERGHWVGDGFPVRTLFDYGASPEKISPFLLFDFAGPYDFAPADAPRGVGPHPHRGFETVTLVFEGEVSHRDNAGHGGAIGPGDVQWMTAGSGVLHDEFHSDGFTRTGGRFRVAQLWVNLPAGRKMTAPRYQAITDAMIPRTALGEGVSARVVAGELDGVSGPAQTFSPINMWDVALSDGASARLALPKEHNVLATVMSGRVRVNGAWLDEAKTARLARGAEALDLEAEGDAQILVLTGEPIDEPVAGRGPFVMNTAGEVDQAYADFRAGRFGTMPD